MIRARNPQAGMTLLEIMIAIAIMVVMMTLAWKTIANTSESKKVFENYEERNHELRMALGRIVRDFEAAYLSGNETPNAVYPRTMFVAKATGRVPQIRFSTMRGRSCTYPSLPAPAVNTVRALPSVPKTST